MWKKYRIIWYVARMIWFPINVWKTYYSRSTSTLWFWLCKEMQLTQSGTWCTGESHLQRIMVFIHCDRRWATDRRVGGVSSAARIRHGGEVPDWVSCHRTRALVADWRPLLRDIAISALWTVIAASQQPQLAVSSANGQTENHQWRNTFYPWHLCVSTATLLKLFQDIKRQDVNSNTGVT